MLRSYVFLLAATPFLLACSVKILGVPQGEATAEAEPMDSGTIPDAQRRERPISCHPASLERLSQPDFMGAPNGRIQEGATDLEFDEVCNAFTVTMISGQDYLRQLSPNGALTEWNGATNLNMGQVAVLRLPLDEFSTQDGEVFLTYTCCSACGCVEDGRDQRQGIVRLDRTSSTRALPNVLPAKPTEGKGPFGHPYTDTGPYGPTWGADRSLYVGNVEKNGDFIRVDRTSLLTKTVAQFPARVTAAAIHDFENLLVATEDKIIYKLSIVKADYSYAAWSKLPGFVTSMKKDWFRNRIYAEVATSPPQIVEIDASDGSFVPFRSVPALGRIAIAPDGHLYHLTHPLFRTASTDHIMRWSLPKEPSP